MGARKKTADTRQGLRIVGFVLLVSMVLGYAVLPMLKPGQSRLVGVPAPKFTLPVMHNGEPGSRLSLSDLEGRAVVIDFWASWCPPCRAQAPIIDRVARRHRGRDVVVVGISTSGDDWGKAVKFAKAMSLSYMTVFDADDSVGRAYGVRELPTLVVLNRAGEIVAVRNRLVKEADIEKLIAQALESSPGTAG